MTEGASVAEAGTYGLSCPLATIRRLPPVQSDIGTFVIGVLRAGCHRGPERQDASIAAVALRKQAISE
ncbi:hypothetical protein GCM10012287_10100 [Streptomyces daqingensis]|uniref:Uncharacterized protein n=1 Tax=Streptomyces daqingensis TaxID=1472640 RepID=A0ABQ2LXQ3_9ACTN|nr:hypothetical protein GCM10012287_10100 [Streptomyces daqingensis]